MDIAEKFSDNILARKRGRPRKLPESLTASYTALWGEGGPRTIQNRIYSTQALALLGGTKALKDYPWLFEERPDGNYKRITLQTEIGRLGDPNKAREVAAYICREKPTVTRGAAMIRGYRKAMNGKGSDLASSPEDIANTIIRAINDLLATRPGTTNASIKQALAMAYHSIPEGEAAK